MIIHYQVHGTQDDRPPELQVDVTTVYIRSNIERVENDEFVGWVYDEIQYSKDEFQELIASKTNNIEQTNEVLAIGLADTYETQLMSELKLEQETTASLVALADAYELIMQLEARIQQLEGGNN